ncbi:undecaprenyl-diphosphatase [Klebsiella aerogenes]|uniref:undecaprenyl-diphosphatase n=1 Tax=Enterobacteriaceae TaxID=543 RepID=UPI00049F36E5|nr:MULTISPECIES: undecaprenyl-diphosphatase [Enterobacteriaceae]EGT5696097.1 undecaprenyl-diphosphatase [Cronobacter sakazakii]EGT5721007.1 undecaprenyl-diphosphatase [Cronobacter sakazakii]EJG0682066.1 undecaprenyl-diphosphatase [Cronobacter sakazakii]EJG0825986.1 undecaprenyl-diphosphatase [Cronobacter sakazakii]EJQ2009057.1 undecaprenyl-diphosphatase [Cronobacter sakazakii]
MLNEIETLNRKIFLTMNAKPGTPDSALVIANFFANTLIYAIPVIIILLWFAGKEKGKMLALRSTLTMVIGVVLSLIIGTLWPHPRPFMIPLGYVWFSHTADYSFPSDHMTIFVCFALALISAKAARTGLLLLGISILVAWSRIYLGVHFPLDMAGAVVTGIVSDVLFCRLWRYKGEDIFYFFKAISLKLFKI